MSVVRGFRPLIWGAALGLSFALGASAQQAGAPQTPAPADERDEPAVPRLLEFSYETTIGPVPAGSDPVHVWIPLALEDEYQRILSSEVTANIPGREDSEPAYGNRFWHGIQERPDGKPIEVRVDYRIERRPFSRSADVPAAPRGLSGEERVEFERFLRANERVVVGHEILVPIQAELRAATPSKAPADRARAIYDWVVDNLEYKKVGTGWGNGDTFWACNERYGNCTDFHSLFISLARSDGIPARFEMGFPIPEDRTDGQIGGYHCWVDFYLPDVGWFPIDASEAFKHPDKRELFYGTQPADRIHFTTGRDLRLGPDHKGRPLNYFIYPYVEVGGEAWKGEVTRSFRYRDVSAEEARIGGRTP